MNCKIQYRFYRNGKFIVSFDEHTAKPYARMHPTYTIEVVNCGKLLERLTASDCFNVEPKERETK